MINLEGLLAKLKQKDEVDAVLLTGSQGRGEHKEYSDIDLLIILRENTEHIFSLYQIIDNKPADIFFSDIDALRKIAEQDTLPANTMEAAFIDWLKEGRVEFDKSGTLSALQAKVDELKKKARVPEPEMRKFESLINHGYLTNKRYYASKQPEYLEALEVKMLADINNILVGYFEFRNIPWRGEKRMIKYLKETDPEFYSLFFTFIRTGNNIDEKFTIYEKLISKVFFGDYRLWTKDTISPSIKGPMEEEKRFSLIEYWAKLIG